METPTVLPRLQGFTTSFPLRSSNGERRGSSSTSRALVPFPTSIPSGTGMPLSLKTALPAALSIDSAQAE